MDRSPSARRSHAAPEVELTDFARTHGWQTLFEQHGADPDDVLRGLTALAALFPGRRRVRPLELASLLDARSDVIIPGGAVLRAALGQSLRDNYRCALVVDHASQAPLNGPPILLASSPRSGNTLVQRLFSELISYPVVAAPTTDDLVTRKLTGPVLMQSHVRADIEALEFLERIGGRVLTVARHPLDVLLSVLHFSRHEPQILDWLDGECIPSPDVLVDASPTSDRFASWATGDGARALLSITHGWWSRPETLKIRYEDLVADAATTMSALFARLGFPPLSPKLEVEEVRESALVGLSNHFRWRSKPGGWADLLPQELAERIYTAHREVFEDLGYGLNDVKVAPSLGDAQASWDLLKR